MCELPGICEWKYHYVCMCVTLCVYVCVCVCVCIRNIIDKSVCVCVCVCQASNFYEWKKMEESDVYNFMDDHKLYTDAFRQ